MAYEPTVWRDKRAGGTLIDANALNKLEQGVKAASAAGDDAVPVGAVIAFAGQNAPEGWLLCQGQSLSRTQYPRLFAAIGVQYGAASNSQFSLPDMRTRVPVGKAAAGTFAVLGAKGGAETHTLTVAQMPAHNHNATTGGKTMGMWKTNAGGGSQWELLSTSGGNQVSGFDISNTGGGQAHNILQPYIVMNFIIRAA